jgi:sugar transferase EpsL
MIKRIFDLLVSCSLFLVLLPIFVIVGILVSIKLGNPVIFTQTRPGLDAKPFRLMKFRTMTNEKDVHGVLLPNEKRMTRFGVKLRSTSLDELPGLINVIKGDLSLVGPRPLLMDYLPLFNDFQMKRMNVRPGITGWAQVNGRNSISWDEKFAYDVWYVENQSFFLDLKILLMTVSKVLKRDGITHSGDVTMPRFKGNGRSASGS